MSGLGLDGAINNSLKKHLVSKTGPQSLIYCFIVKIENIKFNKNFKALL